MVRADALGHGVDRARQGSAGTPLRSMLMAGAALAALLSLWAGACSARLGDGSLLLRWTGSPDSAATVVLMGPAGLESAVPLGPSSQGPAEHRFQRQAAGLVRLELRTAAGGVLRRWDVPLAAELTTVALLDLTRSTLRIDPAHPDPFGNWESWERAELAVLPGVGIEGALALDSRPGPPVSPVLDGHDLSRSDHLQPLRFGLEDYAMSVQVPLGSLPPAMSRATPWILTEHPPATDAAAEIGQGSGGRALQQLRGRMSRGLGRLGPVDADATVQGLTLADAGPIGIADDRLPHNRLSGVETRTRVALRPGGRGLLRLDFYASGEQRKHYLQEFKLDPEHAPREDRANLMSSASYDFRTGPASLSLDGMYTRTFTETGDGQAFDVFENYDNYTQDADADRAPSQDGLYWSDRPNNRHVYNYYARNLTGSWTLRGDGTMDILPVAPLRLGAEATWSTYRWYEHLDPLAAARQGLAGGGFNLASYLGYSLDGDTQSDPALHAPRSPRRLALNAAQRAQLGPLAVEGGARWEGFRSGQQAVRNLADPLGADTLADESLDLAPTSSHSGVDPRLGLYLPVAGISFWLDGSQTREIPPAEALYYSPNVLKLQASLARDTQLRTARSLIFGNPALKPEVRRSAQLGFFRTLGLHASLRGSFHLAEVRDVWVAVRRDAGFDSLNYYDNRGKRRESGAHLGLTLMPGKQTRLRILYDLARIETNVIEPAPLYQGWLLPGGANEGTGSLETAPLTPLWFDDGRDRGYFPSLFDHTHRLSAALVTHLNPSTVGDLLAPLLGNADLALTARLASGAPYTPTYVKPEGLMAYDEGLYGGALQPGQPLAGSEINSARMPWTWQLDLGLRKGFRLFGGEAALLLEGRNLTGQKNALLVYGATGKADDDGWLSRPEGARYAAEQGGSFAAAYRDRLDNPLHYDEGRTLRAALTYELSARP